MTGLPEQGALGYARLTAFQDKLAQLGRIDGRNIRINYGADGGDPASARANAAELARLSPEVIPVNSATSLNALVQETRTVPTVFVNVGEQSVMLCLR